MTPSATLLQAFAGRDPAYVLFQPEDMPDAHWLFIVEAVTFAEKACEEVVSTPAGPPN